MGWGNRAAPSEPQSGLEMGLRVALKIAGVNSEEVFGQVKAFAENGTLQKIIDFSEAVETQNFILGLIYNELRRSNPELSDLASAVAAFKSRAGGGNGEHGQLATNRLALASGNDPGVSDA